MPRERLLIWKDYLRLDIPEVKEYLQKQLENNTIENPEKERIGDIIKDLDSVYIIISEKPIQKTEEKFANKQSKFVQRNA